MKTKILFALLIVSSLLIGNFSFTSQEFIPRDGKPDFEDDWKKVDSLKNIGMYKSALQIVDSLYTIAYQKNYSEQIIKTYIFKLHFLNTLEENAFERLLYQLRDEIPKQKPAEKAIMNSMLAEMYWMYYQNNRYKFLNRTNVSIFDPNDIETWTLDNLIDHTTKHYLESVQGAEAIKKIPVDAYSELIIKGSADKKLRPTLYDFIINRAIGFFASSEISSSRPLDYFELNNATLFADINLFLAYKPTTKDSSSLHFNALQMYQQWLAFRKSDKTNPDALFFADKQRLLFVNQYAVNTNKDSTYFAGLQLFKQKYNSSKHLGEILYLEADYYHKKGGVDNWAKAYNICQSIREKYPKQPAAKKAKYLMLQLDTKSLSFSADENISPETPYLLSVGYRNISTIYYKVGEISQSNYYTLTQKYYGQEIIDKLQAKAKFGETKSINLPNAKNRVAHTTQFAMEGLKAGFYVVMIADNDQFSIKKQFVAFDAINVSNLSYINTTLENGNHEFFVLDRKTGQPIADVKCQSYYSYYPPKSWQVKWKKDKLYTTDSNGQFTIKTLPKNESRSYKVDFEWGNNKLSTHTSFTVEKDEPYDYTNRNTFLFTDRAIYRPGQTIHFKGIRIIEHNGQHKPDTKQKVNIRLFDPNYQVVAEMNLETNEFGSFSGSFNIPTANLNGNYQLRASYGSKNIKVEEYKRPKFEVKLNKFEGDYLLNQNVEVSGFAETFFGVKLNDAKVKYRITRQPAFSYWWWRYQSPTIEIANGTATTDKNGAFKIIFPAKPDLKSGTASNVSFRYTISVDVTDLDGETRSTSGSINVGYSALRIETDISEQLLQSSIDKLNVTAQNLNGQQQKATGKISIFLLKENPKTLVDNAAKGDTTLYHHEQWSKLFPHLAYNDNHKIQNLEKAKEVLNANFDTQKPIDLKALKLNVGRYVIEIESKDKFGNKVAQTEYFTVFNTQKTLPYPTPIWFVPLKTNCEPGETAKILIGTGLENVRIVFQHEKRNNEVAKQWLTLSNEQRLIEIPVSEDQRGNFSVSFYFVKDNKYYKKQQTISVPFSNKKLDISFETFRDKLLPGEQEKWIMKISGSKKDKVMAEMVATLYDASLDQFAQNQWYFGYLKYFSQQHSIYTNCFNSNSSSSYNISGNEYTSFPSFSYDRFNWFNFSYHSFDRFFYSIESENGSDMLDEVVVASSPKRSRMTNDKKKSEEKKIATHVQLAGKQSMKNDDEEAELEPTVETSGEPQEIALRKNLNETVFFYPHLKTDAEGNLIIEFTMNEALTKWKMKGFAHTKDLSYGFVENELITQKDLMIVPNPPRFFRENDNIFFTAKVSNVSDKTLAGTARLELLDALTMKKLDIIKTPEVNFETQSKQSTGIEWEFEVPEGVGAIMYRVSAKAGSFTDGQQDVKPVMTNRMLVTETMPLYVRGNENQTFDFKALREKTKSKTLRHHQLTLEFSSNPAWYAVQALPYLMEYPYECNEQTFSRYYANSLASFVVNSSPKIKSVFDQWKNVDKDALVSNLEKNQELKSILLQETPWVLNAQNETVRKQNIALLFDLNKMSNELNTAITKLQKEQYASGAWPWFNGMPESRYVTQHIAKGFGQLNHLKVIDIQTDNRIRAMLPKAVQYLDKEMNKDYQDLKRFYKKEQEKMEDDHLSYMALHYLYMRSFYNYELNNSYTEAYNYYINQAEKYWMKRDIYSQGLIAIILNRANKKQTAKTIAKSLKERSISHHEMGMYWKQNVSGWYWYQAPISTQAVMIEVFDEVANDDAAVADLRLWLLKQKQTQDWGTTIATVDAIYALLLRGTDWLANNQLVDITVGGQKIDPMKNAQNKPEAGTGYFKMKWQADKITKEMANVELKNPNDVPAWGGMYWQYFEQLDKITQHETNLKLKKELFKQVQTNKGLVLKPLTQKDKLEVGDRVVVRIEIRVDRAMEYVHLKDMRASGFEPENVISRYKYQDGLGYYESTKDASTNFFIGYLPKGTYVFEYPLRATLKGNFSNGITSIQCMYAPEFASHSKGVRVQIK